MEWLEQGFRELGEWAPQRVPDVVLALAVVVAGYLVARLAQALAARALRHWSLGLVGVVERVSRRRGLAAELSRDQAENLAAGVASRILFWLVFSLFLAAATAVAGVPVVASWLEGFAAYLPRVLAAAAIVLLGVLGGHLARIVVLSGALSAGLTYSQSLSRAAQGAVIAVASVIAIEELGVQTTFLVVLVGIALAALLGGFALAFGLGARGEVGNLVAGHYLSRVYRVGHRVRVASHEGIIVEMLPHAVVLQTAGGRAVIPARLFTSEVSILLSADES